MMRLDNCQIPWLNEGGKKLVWATTHVSPAVAVAGECNEVMGATVPPKFPGWVASRRKSYRGQPTHSTPIGLILRCKVPRPFCSRRRVCASRPTFQVLRTSYSLGRTGCKAPDPWKHDSSGEVNCVNSESCALAPFIKSNPSEMM